MKRIEPTSIEFKNEHTPYSPRFQDIYFDSTNGIQESTHVYLEGSGFTRAIKNGKDGEHFTVGEIGFGVALNFLLTYQYFLTHSKKDQKLTYLSAEKYPVGIEDIKKLYSLFPELAKVANDLESQYPILTPGFHTLTFAEGKVKLILMLGDAKEMFSQVDISGSEGVQFWYWDGFSPQKNPEVFQNTLFKELIRISAPGAMGSSFTAAGWVRRGLEEVGFSVEKRPGFGIKRECIRAQLSKPGPIKSSKPWFSGEKLKFLKKGDRVAVIGGGLSGTAIARALADRSFNITLIDQESIAAHASGNPIGLFNIQMSRLPNPISRFSQLSLVHFLRELKSSGIPARKGTLRTYSENDSAALNASEYPESFYENRKEGIYFPECGVINPRKLCEQRAHHPLIKVCVANIVRVEKNGDGFFLKNSEDKTVAEAEHVVYATGAAQVLNHHLDHPFLKELPLRSIRGQMILVNPTEASQNLSVVLTGARYITPLVPEISGSNTHCIGATYQAKNIHDDQENIDTDQLLEEARLKHPAFSKLSKRDLISTRVGYRVSTPDKLPIIGPLCDPSFLREEYARVLSGSRDPGRKPLSSEAGEWLFFAMGSRGITFSSLGAEILAALMCGEILPVENDLWEHLHSARFYVRSLKKQG